MDQKLLRYFASLREETEVSQRGASADIAEVVSDISRLCEELVTDEDISLALAVVFDKAAGIFDVVERLLLNRDRSIQKGRESCLVFVAEFIKKIGSRAIFYAPYIKERCMNIFQRDESKSVQAAALLPLIALLELCMQNIISSRFCLDWATAKVLLQEYRKAKSSGTLRSNILIVLGAMVECFPSMFEEDNAFTILNICLDSLDEQLRQKGKDPLFVLVAGAMKCLDGLLTWFDRTLPAGGSVEASRRIYTYLEQVLYYREDLKRYEMVKAGLRLLSRHACFFRIRLLEDSMVFLRWLESYCSHVNAQLRDIALPAFNEFMVQVSACLCSEDHRIQNAQHLYKKLLTHALDTLDAKDQSAKLVTLAIRMVGKLSPAIMKFSGKHVLQQAFQRVVAFGSFSQRASDVQEESLGFSVTLVGAIADIIESLHEIDNYIVTVVSEAVGNIFFSFPNLFPKQKRAVYATIQELFKALHKQGTIFPVFLNNIVWSSLERAIEPVTEEKGEPRREFWKNYTELWSNLIDFRSANDHHREETEEIPECSMNGGDLQIQERIFDAMVVCVMKLLRELNLKYRVKWATADKESVASSGETEVLNPDSDNNQIEPLNDQHMKKFLNLVEFFQELLLSPRVPYYAKWVLPLVQCLIELSSCYPLLSGFYKLLAVIMKIGDDHGYFSEFAAPSMNSAGSNEGQQKLLSQEGSWGFEEECALCKALLGRYLQEVLVASKRYKLELLASCLRLCLSAPPSLLDMGVLVDPIKVSLKMGLRYSPLANVAMDALERRLTFHRGELELWLDKIVPCFNNYLSITLAASSSEPENPDSASRTRNRSVRRIHRERGEGLQLDSTEYIRLRIQKFLGRIGKHAHALVPDVNLLQVAGAGGLAWDTMDQLRFILPFRDDKTDAWLDPLLPRIVDLALSANERSTKVGASELLHAMCLLMMGNAAKGPSRGRNGERPSVHYEKLYRKVFPAVIRLAADVEQVTRDLFSRLVMQMIHWFTSNAQKENPDTMALLDSILEGLVDSENASLREFCADCFEEFMRWSIRHAPPEVDNFANITSMLRRLYNRLDHPNPYHRLGSAMACSRLYRVMRENTSIVDRNLLEISFFCIKSLRISETDHEQIGTIKQLSKVLEELQRLLKRNIFVLLVKRKDRAMFPTIDDFLAWLFKQTTRPQEKCRSRCMYLFSSTCASLPVDSRSSWLEAFKHSEALDRACTLIDARLSFSLQDDSRLSVDNLEHAMKFLSRSLHWCKWALKIELIDLQELSPRISNLLDSVQGFVKSLLNANRSINFGFLTPSELEQHDRVCCRTIMYFLSFAKEIICKGLGLRDDDAPSLAHHAIGKAEQSAVVSRLVPMGDPEFFHLFFLLLLAPQELGCKSIYSQSYETLSKLVMRLLKLLLSCSLTTKERVVQSLQDLLVKRLDLDLVNLKVSCNSLETAGSFGLEDVQCLLKGYQQLLLAGLLLPALGKEKSCFLAERLLMMVFSLSRGCSSTVESYASEILSLSVSLGIKVERLLDLVFDQTPASNSSPDNANITAGSVFYMHFHRVLIQQVKFFYKESLRLLLREAPENPMARLFVSAVLDNYLCSKTEGNMITIKSFLNEFVNQIVSLRPCCKPDAPYDAKLFLLEVLYKLLALDVDCQTLLSPSQPSFQFIVDSFFSCLSGSSTSEDVAPKTFNKGMNLVVQNSALTLVPFFLKSASAHMFLHRVTNALMNIVTTFLLVREADLPSGSTQRATYLQTLDRILAAVCASRNPELLEVLFPLLQNAMPITMTRLMRVLKQFACDIGDRRSGVCSMCLQTLHDKTKLPSLRRAVIEHVLIPVLEATPMDFLLAWFAEHIKEFLLAISKKPDIDQQQEVEQEEDYLVVKMCTYMILARLFMKATASAIRDAITSLVSNQQLIQVATNDSRAKNDPPVYLFQDNVELWRELHVHAYNCLAAIVMCTQDQEKIFTILFKDFAGKPLWQQLIDCKRIYCSFPVEISQLGSLQDVTRNLRFDRKALENSNGITPPMLSQYVIGATLSQEPSLIESFIGGASKKQEGMLEDSETGKELPGVGNDLLETDMVDPDDFDQHPSLPVVLKLIAHLHSRFKGASSQDMPEWMKALHSTLTSSGTPTNVCLFLIKVVIKARKIFAPFGRLWMTAIVQPFLMDPESSGGKRLHYILRDVCITILEWNLPTPPSQDMASRFVNYLLEVTPHESNQVLRANLEIVQHFLGRWKDVATIDIAIIASYLTAGGKSPNTSDKMVIMHRIVGVQLLGAMISAGLPLYDEAKLSEKDLMKSLLSNISVKVKGVYEASAELLGVLLQKQKDLHHEQSLESGLRQVLLGIYKEGETGQFLNIVDKITLHCPSFLGGYSSMIFDLLPRIHGVFRVLALSIILRCPSAIPNLFSVVLPFLSKMLTHRDELAQMKSLQLVAELVKDADEKTINEQVLPVLHETFVLHDSIECRKTYYEILIFLYTTRKIHDSELLTRSLLVGLCDNLSAIRESLHNFWHMQLSSNPQWRFLETITRLYDPVIEGHWVHIASSLLLKLCEEAVDFKRPIFNAPLSDCEFKEYTIDTSILTGTLPMTPMFLDSQASSSQSQMQEDDSGEPSPHKRTPGMIRATLTQSQSLDASQARSSFSTFTLGEGESSLFALSQKQSRRVSDSMVQDTRDLDGGSPMVRRRIFHPSSSRPQILRSVLNTMKRKEARMAQQALERANKVQIMRTYRIGDLPDIEIKHEEIIKPLAALGEQDSSFSRLLLQVLCRAIYALSGNQYVDGEHDLKSLVTKAIEKVFDRTHNNISFVSSALSICLEDKESWIDPKLVGSISKKSTNFQSGILYLENALLRANVPWEFVGNAKKRHKGPQGRVSLEPSSLDQAWLELADLYRSIEESDIVLSIYKQHLTKASITHHALEAELRGETGRALKLYDKAIDQFDEVEGGSVVSTAVEQDLWYTRRLHCLANLLDWRAVMEDILFQVDDELEKLWEPKAQDSYLSLFIRAAIKMPTHHTKLAEFLQPVTEDSWKKSLILKDFSTQVATLAVSNEQVDRARFYINECYKSFLKHWAEFHPLAASARRLQIRKLQMTTELHEHVDQMMQYQPSEWFRLLGEWRSRWPSPTLDDAEAWDDIVQNRVLFFQKLQSTFNKHLDEGKEEEGVRFAHRLEDERALVYHEASKGLMKQGSVEAAKNYMNQFVALCKDKLDFNSYKTVIKLRCLEAGRASGIDQQKAVAMLNQVLKYIHGTSQKHKEETQLQHGLKLLEGSTYFQLGLLSANMITRGSMSVESIDSCLKHLGSGFIALRDGIQGMDVGGHQVSSHTLAKSLLKFSFFCDELLKAAETAKWGPQMQEAMRRGNKEAGLPPASAYPVLVVKHIMRAVQLNHSIQAHHGIARVLTLLGQYPQTCGEFVSSARDVAKWLFIPWIPQMLSGLDKDDGVNFIAILEEIARLYPQAIYFSYNVSKLDFGPMGCRRASHLESILKSPLLESLVRSLEDLTFPEQRLRDGLSWMKNLLEAGNHEKTKALFKAVCDDCLDVDSMMKDNRRSGEYNLKFAREYSKRVVDALGQQGAKLSSMNDKQFTQATGAVMANLQKALKSLPSGSLSLSSFSKWMADFDQSKDTWSSQENMSFDEAPNPLISSIDMFGSYHGFQEPHPDTHVKVLSFDQTIISLSSKQRPKLLKVRGSDEQEYKFIVKGGEDLRLDQRIEQLFEMMNSILHRDPSCSRRKLSIRTYAVIPVSRQCGLLQFVENTRALDEFIKDGLTGTLPSLGLTGKDAPSEVISNIRVKFHEWLEMRGGSQNVVECYRNMYSRVQYNEICEKMNAFVSSLPWDTLRTALFKLTMSAESFLAIRAQYQRSLAVLSICGYVSGVGDRHLANILVDTKGGGLVPIDFGYSFGTGVILLPVPELVPFRLTHQLMNVMLPQDAAGLLRNDMVHVMNALRNSKDVISAVMDVFVKEPLVDWKMEAMKTNSLRNTTDPQGARTEALEVQATHEAQHVALKVEFAERKLELWNPADITVAELQSSIHAGKPYMQHLEQIVRGNPDRNIRARICGHACDSIEEQIDCLLDQATDVNLLGRIWLGWQPWI